MGVRLIRIQFQRLLERRKGLRVLLLIDLYSAQIGIGDANVGIQLYGLLQ